MAREVSLSHRFVGNLGSTEQRPVIKWFLKVWMARSTVLWLCMTVGVS